MEQHILFISLIFLGAIIGLIAGMVGIGGTTLIVPCLIWIFLKAHLSLDSAVKTAFGSALLVSSLTALAGFLIHRAKVEVKWSLILPLATSAVIGAFCGSNLAHLVKGSILLNIFILVLFIIAFYLIFNFESSSSAPLKLSLIVIIFTGFGTGFLASLVGLGGGLFTVIVFTLFFRQPIHKVIGISTFIQVCGALSAAAGYMLNGYINFLVVLPMLITGVPFAQLGAKIAHKMEPLALRRVFGALLILIGIVLVGSKISR